ncbi:MAG: VCBS repeat-containing protein [Verrucomicrobia bacterium]|nr:VCBS repeat-containing protein [Verrucomicrobiota bacterium]
MPVRQIRHYRTPFFTLPAVFCLLLGWVGAASGHAATLPEFTPVRTLPAITNVWCAASGDFNGDGRPDLVAGSAHAGARATNLMVVLLNRDGETFAKPLPIAAGAPVSSIAVGDLNADGQMDLAVCSGSSEGCIAVLFGTGDGRFQPAVFYPSGGGRPKSMVIADMNHDGKPDLLTANLDFGRGIGLLLNLGDGSFSALQVYAPDLSCDTVVVADFNGDGHPDFATAAQSTLGHSESGLSVFLGSGDGRFAKFRPEAPIQSTAISMAALDLQGDGKTDLLLGTGTGVLVLSGLGTGEFQRLPAYPGVLSTHGGLVTSDFNGDGKADFATTGPAMTSAWIALGRGDGTFEEARVFDSGPRPSALVLADFSGDGRQDLAIANAVPGVITLLSGLGDGGFQDLRHDLTSIRGVAAADLDADGTLDLAVAASRSAVLLGAGGGSFLEQPVAGAVDNEAVAIGDLNGDRRPDLVFTAPRSRGILVCLGRGDGTFDEGRVTPVAAAGEGLLLGDFTDDGLPDVVVAEAKPTGINRQVVILPGRGDGTFAAPALLQVPGTTRAIATGDFNRDGRPDLAVSHSGVANLTILPGTAGGLFEAPRTLTLSGVSADGLLVGDFNADHQDDLAVAHQRGSRVSILLGRGNGSFEPATAVPLEGVPASITSGDLDRDGFPDLMVSQVAATRLAVLMNRGDGTFELGGHLPALRPESEMGVGDFDGDGWNDLATGPFLGEFRVFLNRSRDQVPRLRAALNGGQLHVSWPVEFSGFTLEAVPRLGAFPWSAVTEAPVTNGSHVELRLPLESPGQLLRLRRR